MKCVGGGRSTIKLHTNSGRGPRRLPGGGDNCIGLKREDFLNISLPSNVSERECAGVQAGTNHGHLKKQKLSNSKTVLSISLRNPVKR